jgi:xylulokinase
MAKYFLGIDFGTGGAKACITDKDLNIKAYAYREYPLITNKPGWSEHEPGKYWTITKELITECVSKSDIDPKNIHAIATSSALPALVMLDEKGRTINLAYNLLDRRAVEEVRGLKKLIGEKKIFEVTKNKLEDHPVIVNLLWEKNNRNESFKKIHKALTIDSYVKFKLTGLFNINHSQAVYYGVAYDLVNNRFDDSILKKIGLESSILPEVTSCEDIIGNVSEAAAKETGLSSSTIVLSGQADACAGWLGGGAIEVGDAHINLGTCGVLGIIHKNRTFLDSMINTAYTFNSDSTYVVIGATQNGGLLMRYLRDMISDMERAVEGLYGIDSYDLMTQGAEEIPAGSEGLIILPYITGEKTPTWDADSRGVIFGLSLNHAKPHLIRAAMESVAYALYDSYSIIKEKLPKINYPIVMNEGGAKSRLWRKIITDVLGVPTVFLKNRVGAPFGDCLLAAKASGEIPDYGIARQKAEYIEPLEPDEKDHKTYMEYFDCYRQIYNDLKDDYRSMSDIRK